jgi:hypothetical protein
LIENADPEESKGAHKKLRPTSERAEESGIQTNATLINREASLEPKAKLWHELGRLQQKKTLDQTVKSS